MAGLIRSQMLEGRISDVIRWSDNHLSLRIDTPQQKFLPGQFVRLQLNLDGEDIARSYSLVNTPGDSQLEVYFNRVDGGRRRADPGAKTKARCGLSRLPLAGFRAL